MMPDPDIGFRLFSFAHFAALAGLAAATIGIARLGRAWHGRPAQQALESSLAWTNLAAWTAAHTWWLLPPHFRVEETLPLQMCHLTSIAASIVQLHRPRWARVLLYFWGLVLSTQALITPSLLEGPDSIWFWGFWYLHGMLVVAGVYDIAVHGYRPTLRDYGLACVLTVLYVAVVLPLDVLVGANYGFVGPGRALQPSIVDLLGPWPQRLAIIVPLAAGAMAAGLLPWAWHAGRRRRPAVRAPDGS
jgi:hypothetical integral membrane protein (TIGR02206 family)